MKKLIDKLEKEKILSKEEFIFLIENFDDDLRKYAAEKARKIKEEIYGKDVYIRGLIEFTNYCKNNCYYCGIRYGNKNVSRYRLTKEQILNCCDAGYELGFRTFVLQGGEDKHFTDEILVDIIRNIKTSHPDCAVTLSIGERSYNSYKALKDAGADRYLLRHETANNEHYSKLHPSSLTGANRKKCLYDLKSLNYQVGTGFMVGSPYQTSENLADDLLFIKELKPQMVGIGPFVPHHETPFADKKGGTVELTLFMLSLIRIMCPNVLLPSTTALGTINENGREMGILAGANVVMPNLSPIDVRKKYLLYDNKICTGDESAQCVECMKNRMKSIGCNVVTARGDYKES